MPEVDDSADQWAHSAVRQENGITEEAKRPNETLVCRGSDGKVKLDQLGIPGSQRHQRRKAVSLLYMTYLKLGSPVSRIGRNRRS